MPSTAIALRSEKTLTPAMVACVWEIAAALDEDRVPAEIPNSVWVEMPTRRLRGPGGRSDNAWLKECLERLTEVKISGSHQGNPWGAVVLAEWEITQGGTLARLLIPPTGVKVFRAPATFARIEATAVYRLTGHGRRLYALLADKKRQRHPSWEFSLDELRSLMDVDGRKSYNRWSDFRARVLDPAVRAINDYGTVVVRATPKKLGKSVVAVRFDWHWRDPRDAADTAAESERQEWRGRIGATVSIDSPAELLDHQRRKLGGYAQAALLADRQALAERSGERARKARDASKALKELDSAVQPEFDFFGGGNVSIAFQYQDAVTDRLFASTATGAQAREAMSILWTICRHLGWQSYECTKTASQLCDITRMDKARMARALNLLEDVGAIRRVRRGRVKVITVTPEGAFRGSVQEHGKAVERCRLDVIDGGRADG